MHPWIAPEKMEVMAAVHFQPAMNGESQQVIEWGQLGREENDPGKVNLQFDPAIGNLTSRSRIALGTTQYRIH